MAGSAPPAAAIVAHRAVRAPVSMGAVEARAGNITQHAGEASAPANIRIGLWLELRPCASRTLATLLRVSDGRKGNDPCRKHGEDQFPHDSSPKDASTPPPLKRECRISQAKLRSVVFVLLRFLTVCSESGGHAMQAYGTRESQRALLLLFVQSPDQRIGRGSETPERERVEAD